MADVHFEIVTPERALIAGDAHMIVVPGSEGEFGVLHGHAPFMTTIRPGEIRVYANPTTISQRITVAGGFAEVGDSGLTILAEQAELVA